MSAPALSRLTAWSIQQLCGDSPRGLQSMIDHVSRLPGLANWVPAEGEMHLLDVLCLAATLSRINSVASASLVNKIAQSILQNGHPDPDDMAELTAAALLQEWSSQVRCISRQKSKKTPDFEMMISDEVIEVEVTNSDQKQEQAARQSTACQLAKRLQELSLGNGFRVRFVDQLSEQEIENLLAAASKLVCGTSSQVINRWYVEAVAPDTQPQPPSPVLQWWESEYATPAMMHTTVTQTLGKTPSINTPRNLDIQWMLSTASYLNSLSKKCEAEQASGMKPFIVACNVTRLPGAFGWYEANLMPHLVKWNAAISAVMLIRQGVEHLDTLRWEFRLFVNPNATLPLPDVVKIPASGHVTVPLYSD